MRSLAILMVLYGAILTCCATSAENLLADLNERAIENEPIVLQTPTPLMTPKPRAKFDITSKVGIVDVNDEQIICFRTNDANLSSQTPVSIITSLYEFPQKILTAK